MLDQKSEHCILKSIKFQLFWHFKKFKYVTVNVSSRKAALSIVLSHFNFPVLLQNRAKKHFLYDSVAPQSRLEQKDVGLIVMHRNSDIEFQGAVITNVEHGEDIEMRPSCCSPLNNNSIFINLDAENLTPFSDEAEHRKNHVISANEDEESGSKQKRRRTNTL